MWKPFLLTVLVVMGCKASSSKKAYPEFDITIISTELLGEDYTIIDSSTYALVHTNPSYVGDTRKKIIVIDKNTREVIYGPANINGDVSWYSTHEILVKMKPELIPNKNAKGGSQLKIINVETGENKITL